MFPCHSEQLQLVGLHAFLDNTECGLYVERSAQISQAPWQCFGGCEILACQARGREMGKLVDHAGQDPSWKNEHNRQ